MILDAATLRAGRRGRPDPRAASRAVDLPGRLKTELFASVFETNTDVCADVARGRRGAARRCGAPRRSAAAREGLAIAAAGHASVRTPGGAADRQGGALRRRSSATAASRVRRQGVQGLHVHVGMPSAEDCWRCLEAILPWLPVVLALSANSPWFAGRADGHGVEPRAGARRAAARAARRRAFASYAEWEAWVERLVAARRDRGLHAHLVGRAARIRSSARSRCACPTSRPTCALSAAFAALLQAMCATALDGGLPRPALLGDRACRLRAEPLGGGALRPAREADPS